MACNKALPLIDAHAKEASKLTRAIQRSQGIFSLFFVECNTHALCHNVADSIAYSLDNKPIMLDAAKLINPEVHQLDQWIADQIKNSPTTSAIFLFGMAHLLPAFDEEKLLLHMQQINWRRNAFSRLNRPLVIWLQSYALQILAEHTPDFYDWYSGSYIFGIPVEDSPILLKQFGGYIDADTGLNVIQGMSKAKKRARMQLIRGLLQEYKNNDMGQALLLSEQGNIEYSQGSYNAAIQCLSTSLKIRRDIGDKAGEGIMLNNISQIYGARGDYDTALDFLKQSLAISQKTGNKSGEASVFNNMGAITQKQGDYDDALKYLKQSLAIQQKVGNKSSEGTTLNNISQIYDARGDYDTALKLLQQSLAIQQEIGDKSGEGATLNNISHIYDARGDYDTALKLLQQSLAIEQEIGDKYGEGATLNNISQIYHARGDYETALKLLQQSLAIRQKIGDNAGLCVTLFNMGHIHWGNEETDEAIALWLQVYGIAKQMNLAKILEELEFFTEKLGEQGGLKFWENLADQCNH